MLNLTKSINKWKGEKIAEMLNKTFVKRNCNFTEYRMTEEEEKEFKKFCSSTPFLITTDGIPIFEPNTLVYFFDETDGRLCSIEAKNVTDDEDYEENMYLKKSQVYQELADKYKNLEE